MPGAARGSAVRRGEQRRFGRAHAMVTAPIGASGCPMARQYAEPADVFAWCGGAVLLRSDYLADVGLLDERFFLYYEDTDLSWRGRARGWRYRFVPGRHRPPRSRRHDRRGLGVVRVLHRAQSPAHAAEERAGADGAQRGRRLSRARPTTRHGATSAVRSRRVGARTRSRCRGACAPSPDSPAWRRACCATVGACDLDSELTTMCCSASSPRSEERGDRRVVWRGP